MRIVRHFMGRLIFARMQTHIHNQNGYVILISVLVVSIVGLAIAASVITLGIGSSQTALSSQQSFQARALADACAEHALNELRQSTGYSGSETLMFATGSCEVLAVGGSGNSNRTVQVSGTVGTAVRYVEVIVAEVKPQLQISQWQEVADF